MRDSVSRWCIAKKAKKYFAVNLNIFEFFTVWKILES